MYVVATAGHVDHGKSTLVRALTGMEPDRYEEERRRGLTIDLGYAWFRVGDDDLAFVDVPGHERFIATMLAGLGPVAAVMFVVAADEGWRRQSTEHLAAIDALGLEHGLLVVTRSDLADPGPALAQARERIGRSSLGAVDAVSVSGRTGHGLADLRAAFGRLTARVPPPRTDGRVRFWIDRSFVIRGAGTVVTGTLGAGRLSVGDELAFGDRLLRVRGLQALGVPRAEVRATARVAVNLRGIDADEIGRGDVLLSPGAWRTTACVDAHRTEPLGPEPLGPEPLGPEPLGSDPVRADAGRADAGRTPTPAPLPARLVGHLGTASVPVRVRPLDNDLLRLTLDRALPIEPGDRLVLRDPGRHAVAAGALVLDAEPPTLRRRGAAAARAAELRNARSDTSGPIRARLAREGALPAAGLPEEQRRALRAAGAREPSGWFVHPERWVTWCDQLAEAVRARAAEDPLDPRLSLDAARHLLGLPDREFVAALAAEAGLIVVAGRVQPAKPADVGDALAGALEKLEARLAAAPFDAPERPDLDTWGLGTRELAAAERLGRIVRLTPEVVLLPSGPALAMRRLAALPQPFTTSEARQALETTRRVAIPLLEHLDRRGWTQRLDAGHRRVVDR